MATASPAKDNIAGINDKQGQGKVYTDPTYPSHPLLISQVQ